uniref:hypothetical protein n=1 Tax=Bordetella sputigena TaxID=1416810 RepID=UPI0039EE825D
MSLFRLARVPGARFWDYVIALANLSDDATVYFYDIEASGNQFHERFGVYPAIELDVHMSHRDYISVLHEAPAGAESKAFAAAFTGAYVIAPTSGKWHTHGEYAIEMAELVSSVGGAANPYVPS